MILILRADLHNHLVWQANDAFSVVSDRSVCGADLIGTACLLDVRTSILNDQKIVAVTATDLNRSVHSERVFPKNLSINGHRHRVALGSEEKEGENGNQDNGKKPCDQKNIVFCLLPILDGV